MNTMQGSTPPIISAVICTRNRGDSVVATLETVLANTHPNFEVILVDQSTNGETLQAISHFMEDQRLRYVPTPTSGLGRARNIGLAHARGSIIAFTDDDCTVPSTWLQAVEQIFDQNPHVGVVFCNVAAAPYDQALGFIPTYERRTSAIIHTIYGKWQARGIGAGIAVRQTMLDLVGTFDDHLGAGAMFSSCEDGDMAVRAVLNGWWIYETAETTIVHYGFRTWAEGKKLTKRDWYGIGAAYSKPIKRGRLGILVVIWYEAMVMGFLEPLIKLLRFQRPQGLRRVVYFFQGFMHGLHTPIDHYMRFTTSGHSSNETLQIDRV